MIRFNHSGMNRRTLFVVVLMIACGLNVVLSLPAHAQVYWGKNVRKAATHLAKSHLGGSVNTDAGLACPAEGGTMLVNGGKLVATSNRLFAPTFEYTGGRSAYESRHAAFEAQVQVVPEPSALAYIACLSAVGIGLRKLRRRNRTTC